MTALGRTRYAKAVASAMMLLVLCVNFPINAFADTVSVSLTANGQANSLTLDASTTPFTIQVSAVGATACQMTSPAESGVDTNMTSVINPGHPWYPAAGGSTTFTVVCTDGASNATASVVVSLGASSPTGGTTTGGATTTPITADIKVNGSDGPVTLAPGQTFTYTWTSTNATACQLTSPATSGIDTSGTSVAIGAGHPWYPSTTTPTTLTVVCTNGAANATDSVVVGLGSAPTGGTSVTADIKVNGSDGPVTLAPGQSYTYTWTSTNATACQLTSPALSGIDTSGTSSPISSGHPWYPTTATSTTLTIVCTNGGSNATDSVVVGLGSGGGGGGTNPVTVDVKINGSDGPVTIPNGNAWTYTWTSTNATACQLTSPAVSGVDTSGSSNPINPGHPWYPAVGSSTTITVTCTNGASTATDSAVVNVINPSGGGGSTGCSGACGGSSSSSSNPFGTVLPPVETGAACLFVRDYMRADFNNDPVEVMKLQSFLKVFEGYDYVTINGVYDQATIQAVNAFQVKYRSDILDPWGLKGPTGYTYILTLKKVNELYCLHAFPLNEAQAQEIVAFKALITGLRAQGINPELPASYTSGSRTITVPVTRTETITIPGSSTTATTTTLTIPIVGISTTTPKGQNSTTSLAAVLFAAPKDLMGGLQCVYEFLLILIVLYILGSVLEDVLYKKEDLAKARARFYAKWAVIALGLIVAMIVAYNVHEWCLMLPLLLALIISLVWMALYPKHLGSVRTVKTLMIPGTREVATTTVVEKKA